MNNESFKNAIRQFFPASSNVVTPAPASHNNPIPPSTHVGRMAVTSPLSPVPPAVDVDAFEAAEISIEKYYSDTKKYVFKRYYDCLRRLLKNPENLEVPTLRKQYVIEPKIKRYRCLILDKNSLLGCLIKLNV